MDGGPLHRGLLGLLVSASVGVLVLFLVLGVTGPTEHLHDRGVARAVLGRPERVGGQRRRYGGAA
ncbi:hypothetical protein [Streptomyces sp. NPDC001340]